MSLAEETRYAGFWWRALAYIVDAILVNVLAMIVAAFVLALKGASAADISRPPFWMIFLPTLLRLAYFALFESSAWMATPGKRLCGLLVVTDGYERLSLDRATGRSIARIASGLTFGIGFFMAGWTGRKQALHDKVVETLVLKRLPLVAPSISISA